MTDAPKRIWASPHDPGDDCGTWGVGRRDGDKEYHLARPGQPCSTDEFLERLLADGMGPYGIQFALKQWLAGDFTAAMEGLE